MIAPPPIDERTAADVVVRLVKLLEENTTGPHGAPFPFEPWREYDPATLQPRGISAALIGVFARYAEILIQRLNQVPEKNFLAFLDLLGAARLPPEPARVPLTFSLAAGRTEEVLVPAATRVAAQPAEGDPGPVVFEVEQSLVVTPAVLESLVAFDPYQDTFSDLGGRDPAVDPPFLPFQGTAFVEHVLYLGDDRLLAYPNVTALKLSVTLAQDLSAEEPRQVQWERWNGATWAPLSPSDDTSGATVNLTRSGTLSFGAFAPISLSPAGPRTSRWIRARLLTPVSGSAVEVANMVRASRLPVVTALDLSASVSFATDHQAQKGLLPEAGFSNAVELDLTKEVFPFGERPKRFDTFSLASLEGFSKDPTALNAGANAGVKLYLTVVAAGGASTSPALKLIWECSTAAGWVKVGEGTAAATNTADFKDPTGSFTIAGDATVEFRLPDGAAPVTVNGRESCWLRVRLSEGNYGVEAQYVEDPPGSGKYTFKPPTFAPPVISNIEIGYYFTAHRTPAACVALNDLAFQDLTGAATFAPFVRGPDQARPALALGFTLPKAKASFPNATISLYASAAAARYGELAGPLSPDASSLAGDPGKTVEHVFTVTNPWSATAEVALAVAGAAWDAAVSPSAVVLAPGASAVVKVEVVVPGSALPGDRDLGFLQLDTAASPRLHAARFTTTASALPTTDRAALAWEYWNGAGWAQLAVRDGSQALTRPGLLELLVPGDFAPRSLFGRDRYWIRVAWAGGEYSSFPRVRQLLLNTTLAAQVVTVTREVLGSSTGAAGQVFRSTRAPVLKGPRLEVREPELPGAEEQETLRREEGEDAVGKGPDLWVRWHEVPDFYGSGPRDRHYVMDHLTGEVHFGDGSSGQIPPIGASNIRFARYQTGGGSAANRPAGTVTQLKTTVPYVEKVTNPEAAAGGAEAEPLPALYERMPRTLRHRDRAVTAEDYEDLAALTSPEVARSRCVPLRDLVADPLGLLARPGVVSVIVVPRSADGKPQPSLELLGRVSDFLSARAPAGSTLQVVGPLYIRVDVRVEIGISSPEAAISVAALVRERLAAFLHPLTGGMDSMGWDFGRAPHRSDLLALIEGLEGVDHVRFLQIEETEEVTGAQHTGRFLVYSGRHQIDLVFETT